MNDWATYLDRETLKQTSASFFSRLADQREKLAEILEASGPLSPDQIDTLARLFAQAGSRARFWKFLNSIFFLATVLTFFLGAVWQPVVLLFVPALTNQTVSGVFQFMVTFFVGGFLLGVYQSAKMRQLQLEDAMRRAMFDDRSFAEKVERLEQAIKIFRGRKSASAGRQTLEEMYQTELQKPDGADPQRAANLVRIFDLRIKTYAYRNVMIVALGAAAVLTGFTLALPYLEFLKQNADVQASIATVQKSLIAGFWGFLLAVIYKYRTKAAKLREALRDSLDPETSPQMRSNDLLNRIMDIDKGYDK